MARVEREYCRREWPRAEGETAAAGPCMAELASSLQQRALPVRAAHVRAYAATGTGTTAWHWQ